MFCDETFVNLMHLSCFVSTCILLFSVLFLCGKPNDFLAILPSSERSSFLTEYGSVACTQKDIICVESIQRRAARFVCNDYCRSSSVNTMLSNLGRQDLETRRKITDLKLFFKIKTGNVRISFPNDLREVHCPYLTRGSAQHPFQFQRYSSTINAHKCSFFVRTVPAWNALSPVSVCADSVAVFHSSVDDFYLFYCFFFCCIKNHEYSLRNKKTIL